MSFTTPTISYLDAYWILDGPKCLPSGFSFLKNRRAKASLITATGRVVGVSSSVKGRPIALGAPRVAKKPGVARAQPALVSSLGGGSGLPAMRTPSFQL